MPDFAETPKVPVSVIIPCYNCSETIERAVSSVIRQTRLPEELLLVNDASSDQGKTVATLKQIQDRLEGTFSVRVIDFKDNQGPAAARNAGWENASQSYLAFLDADDVWHPQKLELVYAVATQYPKMDLIGHDFFLPQDLEAAGRVYGASEPQRVIRKGFYSVLLLNPFVTPSFFLKKKILQRMNPRLRYCEDHEFLLRVADTGQVCCLRAKLVQLGRAAFSEGGLSANRLLMRKGEILMYLEAMKYRRTLVPFLPLLILFSMIKHLALSSLLPIWRRAHQRDKGRS